MQGTNRGYISATPFEMAVYPYHSLNDENILLQMLRHRSTQHPVLLPDVVVRFEVDNHQ